MFTNLGKFLQRGIRMKKIWGIFKNDMHHLLTNWVSAAIIVGLIVLPSLYAWLNIAASWDPYGNTKNIPVGIVNEDEGGKIENQSVRAGDDLVANLKKNKEMDWQFLNKDKAMDELRNGDLFAVIVVPKDFSKKLSTITNDSPQKAQMEYYVNEKINSIAPKITDRGASMLVTTMSSKFVGTVNGTIFELYNKLGIDIQKNLPDIQNFEKFIFQLEKDLPGIHKGLLGAKKTANTADQMLKEAKAKIPEAAQTTTEGLNTVTTAMTYVTTAQKAMDTLEPRIEQDLKTLQSAMQEIRNIRKTIEQRSIDTSGLVQKQNAIMEQTTQSINRLTSIESALLTIKRFNQANKLNEANATLTPAIKDIRATKASLQSTQRNIRTLDADVSTAKNNIQTAQKELDALAQRITSEMNQFIRSYQNTISPDIKKELANAKQTLTQAQSMLTELQVSLPKAQSVLDETSGYVNTGQTALNDALGKYPFLKSKVDELAGKLRQFDDKVDINKLIKLLLNNPNKEKSFFEEPIKLKENAVFPVKNYGTGMTPFYGVLSLWVGGLLLMSLLSVNVKKPENYKYSEIYFGKLLIFWVIGICQALVMSSGTILIIGVQPVSPLFFILFCVFISMVFMTIVYTLVSLFNNVGKALSIVLLVLQLAGAGGTYPVVLLPKFFQIINPFLPFTYAIEMVREAVAGIIWSKVALDMTVLIGIAVAFLIIGALFKNPVNRGTAHLLKKSKESGLFH